MLSSFHKYAWIITPILAVISLPWARLGGLVTYSMTAMLLFLISLKVRTQQKVFVLIGLVAICFSSSAVLEYARYSRDLTDILGYIGVGISSLYLFRSRVSRVEKASFFEALAIVCVGSMGVIIANSFFANSMVDLFVQAIFLCGLLVLIVGFVGRKPSVLISLLLLSLCTSGVLELFRNSIPLEHYDRAWSLAYVPVLYALRLPKEKLSLGKASVPARRVFRTHQQIGFVLLQILPLIFLVVANRFGAVHYSVELLVLSLLSVALIMLRFRLLIKERDWSYEQELKLRRFGDEIISIQSKKGLRQTTVNTLHDLVDSAGIVGIVAEKDTTLLDSVGTLKERRSKFKALRFGDEFDSVESWFVNEQKGGTQLAIKVPEFEGTQQDRQYLVASVPVVLNADIEEHFRSAARQYSLALYSNELAAKIREEQSASRFKTLTQDINDVVFLVDARTYEIVFAGSTVERLLGFSSQECLGQNVMEQISNDDAVVAVEQLNSPDGQAFSSQVRDVRLQLANGETRWFEMSVRRLDEVNLKGLLVSFSDVNDRKLAGLNLRSSEARFRTLVQNSSDVSLLVSKSLSVSYVSPNIKRIFNFSTEDLIGSSIIGFVHEDSHLAFNDLIEQCDISDETATAEIYVRASLGTERRLTKTSIVKSELSDEDSYVVIIHDISSRRRLENSLRKKALYDELTGLYNRSAFVHETQVCLQHLESDSFTSVLALNIDNFKQINDSVGFKEGDQILTTVASRLRSVLRGEDKLARLSADEFAVTSNISSSKDATKFAERLDSLLEEPIEINGKFHNITASVGVTVTNDRQVNADDLIQQAVVAMHRSKDADSSAPVLFQQSMQDEAAEQFELLNRLLGALEEDEFSLVYQPLINLNDNSIHSFEALLRWNHPTRGHISPGVFIPLAESNGAILEMGRWVLDKACRKLVEWKQMNDEFAQSEVSVNLSAKQLDREGELGRLTEIIVASEIAPESLTIELTESTMVRDAERISNQLNVLRSMDVDIAIDDFGTGVSGLAHLRELPFDTVKIDKSYVDKLGVSSEGTQLVQQIIELAKAMGAKTVAEGIETPQQLEILSKMGCDIGQGFYLARPMPDIQIVEWMQARYLGKLVNP